MTLDFAPRRIAEDGGDIKVTLTLLIDLNWTRVNNLGLRVHCLTYPNIRLGLSEGADQNKVRNTPLANNKNDLMQHV